MSRPTIKSVLAENEELRAEAVSLQAAHEELTAASESNAESNEKLLAELEGTKQELAALTEQISAAEADQKIVVEENVDLEAEVELLKNFESAAEETADAKAAAIVAAVGIRPISESEEKAQAATSREQVIHDFSNLTDPLERGRFYNQHRDSILNR